MCALAVTGYVWNRPKPVDRKYLGNKFVVEIEYIDHEGRSRMLEYTLEILNRDVGEKKLDIRAVRSHGDFSCTLSVTRSSGEQGSQVTVYHGVQHVSGLREVYKLYNTYTVGGHHDNSMKYGGFEAKFSAGDLDRTRCELKAELIRKSDDWSRTVNYRTKLQSR